MDIHSVWKHKDLWFGHMFWHWLGTNVNSQLRNTENKKTVESATIDEFYLFYFEAHAIGEDINLQSSC